MSHYDKQREKKEKGLEIFENELYSGINALNFFKPSYKDINRKKGIGENKKEGLGDFWGANAAEYLSDSNILKPKIQPLQHVLSVTFNFSDFQDISINVCFAILTDTYKFSKNKKITMKIKKDTIIFTQKKA